MRYDVRVGPRRLRLETSAPGGAAGPGSLDAGLLIDGRVVAYDVREIVASRQWSIVVEGTAHEVFRLGGDPPRFLVDGLEVAVSATDERALAARRGRALAGGGRHEVRAPMPGLLKAIHVSEGEVVARDAPIATLEAMKMENELRAPARALVRRIAAAAGAKVESGALIAVLVEESA